MGGRTEGPTEEEEDEEDEGPACVLWGTNDPATSGMSAAALCISLLVSSSERGKGIFLATFMVLGSWDSYIAKSRDVRLLAHRALFRNRR